MERAKGYGGFGQAVLDFYTIFGPYKCNRNLILNIMKKVVSVLFILAIIVFSVLMVSYSSDQKPEKVLRHVVMFGFKPDVSERR